MEQQFDHTADDESELKRLITSLHQAAIVKESIEEGLTDLVRNACVAIGCEHLFLSRFDSDAQLFVAAACHSSLKPGNVALKQKFMGENYLEHQPVVVGDLSQYNYRLHPDMARMGWKSMLGIPLVTSRGLVGVLEAFSSTPNYFSELKVAMTVLFADQAAEMLEKEYHERNSRYLGAEAELLSDLIKMESESTGSLLYKLGEAFVSAIKSDGIAVFGLEQDTTQNAVQEVMADGFTMRDIGRLKQVLSSDFLNELADSADKDQSDIFIRRGAGLFFAPVMWRKRLTGMVVFYWKQAVLEQNLILLEKFVKRMIGHLIDGFGRQTIYSSIQKIGFTDALTKLANRRLFDYVLERELKKVKRDFKPLSLMIFDVDFFKKINDLYGHLGGDAVLEQLSAVMQTSFRSTDLPARYGGEEFAVILPSTNSEQALIIAEKIRIQIEKMKFYPGGQVIYLTISIGVVTYYDRFAMSIQAIDELVGAADKALYQAKQSGRNRTVPIVIR